MDDNHWCHAASQKVPRKFTLTAGDVGEARWAIEPGLNDHETFLLNMIFQHRFDFFC